MKPSNHTNSSLPSFSISVHAFIDVSLTQEPAEPAPSSLHAQSRFFPPFRSRQPHRSSSCVPRKAPLSTPNFSPSFEHHPGFSNNLNDRRRLLPLKSKTRPPTHSSQHFKKDATQKHSTDFGRHTYISHHSPSPRRYLNDLYRDRTKITGH